MLRAIYTLLFYLAIPLICLRLHRRGKKERGYKRDIGERFGFDASFDNSAAQTHAPTIWVHAVSVGEIRAAFPLIAQLKTRYPKHRLLLTCMTPTGRGVARETLANVNVRYLPYDLPAALHRFIRRWRPSVLVVMETELWPNLLAACESHKIPALLVNARLSEKSRAGYARWPVASLTRDAFGQFRQVLAQSEADATRLRERGSCNVVVSGNVKFDLAIDDSAIARGKAWRAKMGSRKVLLLASTRENEETSLLVAFLSAFPDEAQRPLLVIVPRHPSRFDDVAVQIANADLRASRRTLTEARADDSAWLGDSMGEMQAYYAMCDIAIVGGSFQPLGGQNLIEAAALGKPIVMGPSTFNFSEATRLAVDAGAMRQARNAKQALQFAAEILNDDALRARMGDAAKAFATKHRGATEKTMDAIAEVLQHTSTD